MKNNIKKTAFVLMIFTIVSKILGFGREVVLANYFGATNISDAYLISQTIPGTIFEFIGIAISTSFIPIYTKLESKDRTKASAFTNNLISWLVLISLIIIGLVVIFTESIVNLFASGFDQNTVNLTVMFTRISIFSILFTTLNYILKPYLEINNKFYSATLAGIPYNFIVILFIILGANINIKFLPYGLVYGVIIQFLMLLFSSKKNNFQFKLNFSLEDSQLRKMLLLSLPVILGVSVNQINKIVDRTIASRIVIGGVSAVSYASRLNYFIQGIFVTSIITVIYPRISKNINNNEIEDFKNTLNEAILSISIMVFPIMVGALFFSQPIIDLLFNRGAFNENASIMTARLLFYYSLGIFGMAMREVFSRAFYSMSDTKTPMINGVIGVILNIILNIILSNYMGVSGLALATSLSATVIALLLVYSLREKIGSFGIKNIIINLLKILLISVLMGLSSKIAFEVLLNWFSQNITLISTLFLGGCIYIILLRKVNITEVDLVFDLVNDKLFKRNK